MKFTNIIKKFWAKFNQLSNNKKAQVLLLLLMLILFASGVKSWHFLIPVIAVLVLKGRSQDELEHVAEKITERFQNILNKIKKETHQPREKSIKLGVIILGIIGIIVTIIFWAFLLPVWGVLASIPAFVYLPKKLKLNQVLTGVIILLLVVFPVLSKTLYAPARKKISEAKELKNSEQYEESIETLRTARRTLAVRHFDKYTSQINTLIEKNNKSIQEKNKNDKRSYKKGLEALNSENWNDAIRYFGQVSKDFEKYDEVQDKRKQAKIAKDEQEYEKGLEALDNEEWDKAIEYFQKVSGDCDKYEAAEAKRKEAVSHREKEEYNQGLEAFNSEEWDESINYFEKVSGEYEEKAQNRIDEAKTAKEKEKYDKGLRAFNSGEYEQAISYFEKVSGEYEEKAQDKIDEAKEIIKKEEQEEEEAKASFGRTRTQIFNLLANPAQIEPDIDSTWQYEVTGWERSDLADGTPRWLTNVDGYAYELIGSPARKLTLMGTVRQQLAYSDSANYLVRATLAMRAAGVSKSKVGSILTELVDKASKNPGQEFKKEADDNIIKMIFLQSMSTWSTTIEAKSQ